MAKHPMPEDSTKRDRERDARERELALFDLGLGAGGGDEPPADAPGGILEKAGESVGRYRLLRPLGSGGFGNVWLAEQTEPIHRKVALKLIKPGMDSREIVARFEAERQALAMMDHPNIARVLDAGTSAAGRPYFVLELVQGEPITTHCDRHRLSISQRLELFIAVCQAVHHAHQKAILHRDLKPSNILVAEVDGKVVPKVIDFGIAKALGANTEEALKSSQLATRAGVVVGTPNYMSPEQAGSTPDVDTRSDIYALGVILYELLTGSTPLDSGVSGAAFDEVLRGIRENEPARPSVYVGKAPPPMVAQVAGLRHTDSTHLIRALRGDLDWIVMTALEKDRRRRYQTVNSLAEDIQRHVANEPVSARPPSRLYQLQKLVARHKLWFAVYGIVVAALAGGLSVALCSLADEKRARHEADVARGEANRERAKAKSSEQNAQTEAMQNLAVTRFLKEMLFGADPLTALGQDTTVQRQILDEVAKRIDKKLADQPAVGADLKIAVGQVYGSLGLYEQAEPILREALAFYRSAPAGAGGKIANALDLLSLVHQRQAKQGEAQQEAEKLREAEQEGREAVAIQTSLDGEASIPLAVKKTHLAWTIVSQPGREAEGEELFRQALAIGVRLGKEDANELFDARTGLGNVLRKQDKLDEAEKVFRDSIALRKKAFPGDHPYLANDLHHLGAVLERKSQFGEAEEVYRQCVAIRRKILGVDHPDSDNAQLALVLALRAQEGKKQEAAEACRELLEICRKRPVDKNNGVEKSLIILVEILLRTGNDAGFERLATEIPKAWLYGLDYWARLGRWPEALAAGSKIREIYPSEHLGFYFSALLLVQTGERAAYEELCTKITTQFAGVTHSLAADRMAKACLVLPRPNADLKSVHAMAAAANTAGDDHPARHSFQWGMALAEYRQGNWAVANDWAVRAGRGGTPYSRAAACATQAMAEFQLKQTEAARATLRKCDEIIETEFLKLENGEVGPEWWDWIIGQALLAEAKRMLEG